MANQVMTTSLCFQGQRSGELFRQVLGDERLEYRLHRKQQRRRTVPAGASQRRFLVEDEPRPGQGVSVVTHSTVQPHPLKVDLRLCGNRYVREHERQLAGQLVEPRSRQLQHAPQCGMQ
ncbi:hypothetical protein FQZ97_1031250 [compost metagenome]